MGKCYVVCERNKVQVNKDSYGSKGVALYHKNFGTQNECIDLEKKFSRWSPATF